MMRGGRYRNTLPLRVPERKGAPLTMKPGTSEHPTSTSVESLKCMVQIGALATR